MGITLPLIIGWDCCPVAMVEVIGDLMINAFLVPDAPSTVDLLIKICVREKWRHFNDDPTYD